MMAQHQNKEACVWGKFGIYLVEVWILTKKNKLYVKY